MFSRFSRRQVLSIASFTIAGTVVAIGIPFSHNFFAPKAQAQETSEEVYKGRKIKVIKNQENQVEGNTFDTSIQLFVDSKEIKVIKDKKTNRYLTPLLFGQYETPKNIAKTIIDLGLKFPEKELELDPDID